MDALIFGTATSALDVHTSLLKARAPASYMRIVLVKVPKPLHAKPYGELVSTLSKEFGVLPIGLFRGRNRLRAPVPYVFTNPPSGSPVWFDDYVYVLAPVAGEANDQAQCVRMLPQVDGAAERIVKQHLPIVKSIYREHQPTMTSAVHMFQRALQSTDFEEERELFEPDSSTGWLRQLVSWWRGRHRPAAMMAQAHDFRQFMKERNQRMATVVVDDQAAQGDTHAGANASSSDNFHIVVELAGNSE